jgi:hypothetical protein
MRIRAQIFRRGCLRMITRPPGGKHPAFLLRNLPWHFLEEDTAQSHKPQIMRASVRMASMTAYHGRMSALCRTLSCPTMRFLLPAGGWALTQNLNGRLRGMVRRRAGRDVARSLRRDALVSEVLRTTVMDIQWVAGRDGTCRTQTGKYLTRRCRFRPGQPSSPPPSWGFETLRSERSTALR